MFETGKTAQVTKEMVRYDLDILGVSECRWTGAGERRQEMALQFCFSGRRMHMRMVLPLSSIEVQQRLFLNGSLSAIESSEQGSIPNTLSSLYYNVMPLLMRPRKR